MTTPEPAPPASKAPASTAPASYAAAGVDTAAEEPALAGLKRWVGRTAQFRPELAMLAGLSSFAGVFDIGGGRALALATDGVGSKVLVAQLAGRYETVGIDCVAMNVNDVVAVGAEPIAMLDYLAVDGVDADVFEALGKGLHDGARQAGVAIVGGETSQLPGVITGAVPGRSFDLVGMCVGTIDADAVIDGRAIAPGDVVIGLASSGIHSNGLSLARKVLLDGTDADRAPHPALGRDPLSELLEPTRIYVRSALALIRDPGVAVKALAHITGDGLLNLARVEAPVGFELDDLPTPPPVFELIASRGGVAPAEMYTTFNMGIGFCVVVDEASVPRALQVLASYSEVAQPIGRAVADPSRRVRLTAQGLVGEGRHFRAEA